MRGMSEMNERNRTKDERMSVQQQDDEDEKQNKIERRKKTKTKKPKEIFGKKQIDDMFLKEYLRANPP